MLPVILMKLSARYNCYNIVFKKMQALHKSFCTQSYLEFACNIDETACEAELLQYSIALNAGAL